MQIEERHKVAIEHIGKLLNGIETDLSDILGSECDYIFVSLKHGFKLLDGNPKDLIMASNVKPEEVPSLLAFLAMALRAVNMRAHAVDDMKPTRN